MPTTLPFHETSPTPAARLRLTAEQLAAMPDQGRCELVQGELRHMAPAGGFHGDLTSNLNVLIASFVNRRQLGRVYAAETGFIIQRDPDTVRGPDVAFVRTERLPANRRAPGFIKGPPDLVVEVVSPSDRAGEVEEKIADWLAAGVRMAWVVWPARDEVVVHRPGQPVVTLGLDDELDGQDVLPGFRCKVAEAFA